MPREIQEGAHGSSGPRVGLESLISELSASLVDLASPAAGRKIHHAFEQLLRFFQLDRVALWEFSEDSSEFILLHARHSRGTPPPPARADARHFHWAAGKLLRGEAVVLHGAHDIPESAQAVRSYFAAQGIQSSLSLPLRSEGAVFGALVFASMRQERRWDSKVVARLQMVADIFGSALARQRAEKAWRRTELLETSILNSLHSHVVVVDRQGVIIAANRTWQEFAACNGDSQAPIGIGANYLEGCAASRPCTLPHAEAVRCGLQAVLEGAQPLFEMEYLCRRLGQAHSFLMTVTPLQVPEGGAVILHRDITDLRRAETELQESEQRFRRLADEVPVMMWMREKDSDVFHVNRAGRELTGRLTGDFSLPRWLADVHPDDLKANWDAYASAMDARQKYTLEYRYRHAGGQYRWLLDCGVPRYLPDGSFAGYMGVVLDIQERKEAERERLELAGRLLQAQEEERARIARELHDDIAQRLALLTIRLQQLEGTSPEPRTSRGLADLRKQAKQLSLDVSHLSHSLHSSYLENLGLAAAVENQCREISSAHGLRIECMVRRLPRDLDQDIALSLFRVLQEALRNVLRHSRATRVKVELSADQDGLRLRVGDDGVGFDPQSFDRNEGLGLLSMRERLRLVGGEVTIYTRPAGGTRVEAFIPRAALERAAPGRAATQELKRAG